MPRKDPEPSVGSVSPLFHQHSLASKQMSTWMAWLIQRLLMDCDRLVPQRGAQENAWSLLVTHSWGVVLRKITSVEEESYIHQLSVEKSSTLYRNC